MKIPFQYEDDPTLTWEERYKKLESHHVEEMVFLLDAVETQKLQIREVLRGIELGKYGDALKLLRELLKEDE